MSLIDWKPEFSIGVPAVDHEHKEMISLINRLHENLSDPDSHLTTPEFLGEIYTRISAHFALEEKIMRARHYDHYRDHKNDHERLLNEIRDIMDECEESGGLDDRFLAQRLETWFTVHFRTKDARLHKYLG